jgi:hypothetical protein
MHRIFRVLSSLFVICSSAIIVNGGVTGNFAAADTIGGKVGSVVRTLNPTPSGNGRAIAFDPRDKLLFYTNYGDPAIHVMTNSGAAFSTIYPHDATGQPIMYGALSWDPAGNGMLWGGRYDGSGKVDTINPATGAVSPAFTFAFSLRESCYNQPPGLIDGLAFDRKGHSLWLSDDASHVIYNVKTDGSIIKAFPTPAGKCNSGIANDGNSLWLGLLSGPDTSPYSLARVSKNDPSTILTSYDFGSSAGGPEGLALDATSFSDACLLWSNQFGAPTTIKAWRIPSLLCQGGSDKFAGLTDSIGVLVFSDPNTGQDVGACTASVVQSKNERVIVTAGHCVTDGSKFYTNFRFSPAHTGTIDDMQGCTENCSGKSPYGIWHASASDVVQDLRYTKGYAFNGTEDNAYDYAFIVMDNNSAGEKIGDIAPSLPIQFNQGRNQPWNAYGFPGGPLTMCSTASPGSESPDNSISSDPQFMTMNCDALTQGSSGGPWISSNLTIGGVNAQFVQPNLGSNYERGTYLGCQAAWDFKKAEHRNPGGGPTLILPPNC